MKARIVMILRSFFALAITRCGTESAASRVDLLGSESAR